MPSFLALMITPLRLWPSLRAHPDIRLHVCDSAGLLALLRQAEFDLADQLCWLRWVAAEDTESLAHRRRLHDWRSGSLAHTAYCCPA